MEIPNITSKHCASYWHTELKVVLLKTNSTLNSCSGDSVGISDSIDSTIHGTKIWNWQGFLPLLPNHGCVVPCHSHGWGLQHCKTLSICFQSIFTPIYLSFLQEQWKTWLAYAWRHCAMYHRCTYIALFLSQVFPCITIIQFYFTLGKAPMNWFIELSTSNVGRGFQSDNSN